MKAKALFYNNYSDLWSMKVVITSATSFETEKIRKKIEGMEFSKLQISFHVSGVGILSSCYSLTELFLRERPDLIIQVGIAGCFDANFALGDVVIVKDEVVGDLGVEENGSFKDLFDMKFKGDDEAPYTNKRLVNPWLAKYNLLELDEVKSSTINEISTRQERIKELKIKYAPTIETMEGASLHYVCLLQQVPFIQIRAISNYVGERDKTKWNIQEALENLAFVAGQYLNSLSGHAMNREQILVRSKTQ